MAQGLLFGVAQVAKIVNPVHLSLSDKLVEALAGLMERPIGWIQAQLPVWADQYRTWLAAKLTSPEYHLFTARYAILAEKLGKGIAAASGKKHTLLIIDDYEGLAPTCDLLLRNIMQLAGPRVVWVLSGWGDPTGLTWSSRNYIERFGDHVHTVYLTGLTAEEILECMQLCVLSGQPQPTLQNAALVWNLTQGIPAEVETIMQRWLAGSSISEVVGEPAKDGDQVPQSDLEYTEPQLQFWLTDPEHNSYLPYLYALALTCLPGNADLLSAMFGTTDLASTLYELARRCPFVVAKEMRLHDPIDKILKRRLSDRIEQTKPEIRKIHERALAYLEQRRIEIEKGLATYRERIANPEWQEVEMAIVCHRFWLDDSRGWVELAPVLLGAYYVDRPFLGKLVTIVQQFEPLLSGESLNRLSKLVVFNPDMLATKQEERISWGSTLAALMKRSQLDDGLAHEREQMLAQLCGRREEVSTPAQPVEVAGAEIDQIRRAKSAEECVVLGNLYEDLDKHLIAVAAYERAIALQPNSTQALYGLGNAYLNLGLYNSARSAHREAQEAYKKAEDAYCKIIAYEAGHARAYIGLGDVYYAQRAFDAATANYKHGYECPPSGDESTDKITRAIAARKLGRAYLALERVTLAAEAFQQAINIDERDSEAYLGLGELHLRAQRYDAASESFQMALEYAPKLFEARCKLGHVYLRQYQCDRAERVFEQVLLRDPENIEALIGVAEASFYRNEYVQALIRYQAVIGKAPQNVKALIGSAHAAQMLGEKSEVLRLLENARQFAQDAYERACIEAIAGNIPSALHDLKDALDRYPALAPFAAFDRHLEALRAEAQFAELVRSNRLPLDFGSEHARRHPVYLILECGERMGGLPLLGMQQFATVIINELLNEPQAVEQVCVSIIVYGDGARLLQPLSPISQIGEVQLEARGASDLGAALSLLNDRLDREFIPSTQSLKGDRKPIVLLLVGSEPSDDWRPQLAVLKNRRIGRPTTIAAWTVENVERCSFLREITSNVCLLSDFTPDQLRNFFRAISDSVITTSDAKAASGGVAALPPPPESFVLVL
jgi:uncharacterized protein YegL/cytochrome c-type biogenesis protein CcmH/NrfG